MEYSISYEDDLEKPIESDLINLPKKYIKVYNVNGLVKKKEEYNGEKITRLIYYLDNSEVLNDILNENKNILDIETRKREYIGDYTKIIHNDYYEGELSFENEGISILDKHGNEIYYCSGNDSDKETWKSFFDANGNELYLFWYHNGKLSCMDSYNPKHRPYINEFHQSFYENEFENLEDLDWKNMVYYHSAEPIIPK